MTTLPIPPLLAANAARVAVDGVVAIEQLTFTTLGDRALFVGDAGALFAALTGVPLGVRAPTLAGRSADPHWVPPPPERDPEALPGEARVVSGSLSIAGRDVGRGEHRTLLGAAPLDLPLPSSWTPIEYVAWSARLAGASKRAATDLARAVLTRVGLERAAKRSLKTFVLPERRVLALAAAAVMSPAVIVAEEPLAGLEGSAATFVLSALATVSEGRAALVSATRVEPGSVEGALVKDASWIGVLSGGELVATGEPGSIFTAARTYALVVRTNADALGDELRARGLELHGTASRCTVSLPEGVTTREILAAAAAAKAALVELHPLF